MSCETLNLQVLCLECVDPTLNMARYYVLSIEPGLKRVTDLSVPTHQEAHIHHAHWLRLDPVGAETASPG